MKSIRCRLGRHARVMLRVSSLSSLFVAPTGLVVAHSACHRCGDFPTDIAGSRGLTDAEWERLRDNGNEPWWEIDRAELLRRQVG